MILARGKILEAVKRGAIKVTPFEESAVGPCSIDLRLGNAFRAFKKHGKKIKISGSFAGLPKEATRAVKVKDGRFLEVKPGALVLGVTKERLRLSDGYCGRLEGRSRFARAGLLVHVSSSLIQPGSDNVQVLEIINMSPDSMRLYPGTKVCQVLFEELKGRARYRGEFVRQTKP